MSIFSPSDYPATTGTTADSSSAAPAAPIVEEFAQAFHREGFEIPLIDGTRVAPANFDLAASAPPLAAVADAVTEFPPWYSSVHRGAGFTSSVSTDVLEASRAEIGRFVGARPDDSVVITRNTTDALNLLSQSLPADTTVIGFDVEHHANLLPWRRHRWISLGIPTGPTDAIERLARALSHPASGKNKLVTVTGASNVTGEVFPLSDLAAVAHFHGARIVVDAAQLAPHRAIDIAADGIDYVAFSGHKLYAPFGAGALVGRSDWLDDAAPYLDGGGAVRRVDLDGVDWATGPSRHEAGTPNVVGAYALAVAARTLRTLGFGRIAQHEQTLRQILEEGLDAIPGVVRHLAWADDEDRIGTVTFNIAGWSAADVAGVLSASFGIAVRDGAFCAHPFVAALTDEYRLRHHVHPSVAPSAVRASLGLTTTLDDVDRLIDAVERIAYGDVSRTYRLVAGRPAVGDDHRPRPDFLNALLN